MPKIQIEFVITDDTRAAVKFVADSRDFYAWERTDKTNQRTMTTLLQRMAMTDLAHVGWLAARRQGLIDAASPQAFAEQYVIEFDLADDEEPEDPTPAAAPPAASSNSPYGPESLPMSGPNAQPENWPQPSSY